jgi:hypothetical protein
LKQSNFFLTVLVCVVMVAALVAIGYPGWDYSLKPFKAFDAIEVGKSESDINEFLKARTVEPRPKAADDEWKKHPEAAWKATYETGGKPETIIVWYNARKMAIAKEFGH